MPLTELQCRNASCLPEKKLQRFTDRDGLYLEVTPAGTKSWRLKCYIHGREQRLTLGRFPALGLATARRQAGVMRDSIKAGDDPREKKGVGADIDVAKQAGKQSGMAFDSFEAVALQQLAVWSNGKDKKTVLNANTRLNTYVFPRIGARPVNSLISADFVALLQDLERKAPVTAKKTFQLCCRVMRYAVVISHIKSSPLGGLKPVDFLKEHQEENFARLPLSEMPQFLCRLAGLASRPQTRFAMQLLAMTFVRTKELRMATWAQIDWEQKVWTIPKEIMKMKRPHLVPLATHSIEILKTLQAANCLLYGPEAAGPNWYLFPGERTATQPMSNNTVLKAIERLGYKGRMTGHGFRGIASTALNELKFRPDVIELQLAHVQDKVRGAYNHALYLDERAQMMQFWGDFVDSMKRTGKVPAIEPRTSNDGLNMSTAKPPQRILEAA